MTDASRWGNDGLKGTRRHVFDLWGSGAGRGRVQGKGAIGVGDEWP
jgi:hypothetical protein